MTIRRAVEKDVDKICELLSQVLEIHAKIRPDIFISGTTKYNHDELVEMFKDDEKPIYVAVDDNDAVLGYAFCAPKNQPFSNNMVPFTSLFIDDLCVDASARGQHIGEQLFEHVKSEAKRLGCYEVTLNVWEGNDSARGFYDKMGLKVKESMMEFILK
jgi:ribosomal protein S18 acetylase RimI-like enzyme